MRVSLRINISLDTLKADRFQELTRKDKFHQVMAGIDAACNAGFKKVKLNAVILKGRNDDEVIDLVDFARDRHLDISFIEEMPLGVISEHDRAEAYCSSDEVRAIIDQRYPLTKTDEQTGRTFYLLPYGGFRESYRLYFAALS